jgi:hypothetical protein
MKIIAVDNLNRDEVSDILIAENVHKGYGELLVDLLNKRSSSRYFKLVEDNYKLYEYEI